jgi:hypothetical protein
MPCHPSGERQCWPDSLNVVFRPVRLSPLSTYAPEGTLLPKADRHDVEAEATPVVSSAVTIMGRTFSAASCSQSCVDASSRLIKAAWIFLHRAQTRAPAGLTMRTEAPVHTRRSRSLRAPRKSTMRIVLWKRSTKADTPSWLGLAGCRAQMSRDRPPVVRGQRCH